MTSIRILVGDSLERLAELPGNSVDSVVCDPPYGLGKPPPIEDVLRAWLAGDEYQAKSGGFMGLKWDAFVPGPAIWRQCLRVLKPGGHLVSFFGTRTYDIGTLAIRIAGFEVRDQLAWVYGSGFPKSLDVSKAIDKAAGAEREVLGEIPDRWTQAGGTYNFSTDRAQDTVKVTGPPATSEAKQWVGWGTALKPALEPIVLARKPLSEKTVAANVLRWGTGALNVDATRVAGTGRKMSRPQGWDRADHVAADIIDEVEQLGRWPANLVHDGSQQVLKLFPTSKDGVAVRHRSGGKNCHSDKVKPPMDDLGYGGGGSAARFFYCAKTSGDERDAGLGGPVLSGGERAGGRAEGSAGLANPRAGTSAEGKCDHPTVKPIALMRWMVRLVTPPGGTVLDPFMGSGSTGIAAHLEGFDFIGCELDPHHAATGELRIRHYSGKADIVSEAPRGEVKSREPDRVGFFN